jgi:hypothetical protein
MPQEDFLELVHSGIGEEQRGVVGGNQGGAGNDLMTFFLKETEKGPAYFLACPRVSWL